MSKVETMNSLKVEVKKLKDEVEALKKDRQHYREFMVTEFRTQLQNMTKGQYTPAEALIKRMTEKLNKAESFYIGL